MNLELILSPCELEDLGYRLETLAELQSLLCETFQASF